MRSKYILHVVKKIYNLLFFGVIVTTSQGGDDFKNFISYFFVFFLNISNYFFNYPRLLFLIKIN